MVESTDESILELISKKDLFFAATKNMAEPRAVVEMGNKLTETYDNTIKESALTPKEKWGALVRGINEGGYMAAIPGILVVFAAKMMESPVLGPNLVGFDPVWRSSESLGLVFIAVTVPFLAMVTGWATVVERENRKTNKAVQTATINEKRTLWELIPVNGRVELTSEVIGRKLT